MAHTKVQTSSLVNKDYPNSSGVINLSSTTVNNLVVVHVNLGCFASARTITSVTDNVGNTYEIGDFVNNNGASSLGRLYQVYGIQTTGGATQITVTLDSDDGFQMYADEYSGFGSSPSNSKVFVTRSSGTDAPSGVTVNTSVSPAMNASSKLVVATVGQVPGSGNTFSAGTGYTASLAGTEWVSGEYKLSGTSSETAPGVYTTFGGGVAWVEIATVYKEFIPIPRSYGIINGA